MELREFVAESLKQIIAGIQSAQDDAAQHGAKINPYVDFRRDQGLVFIDDETGALVQQVQFDVAVTATEGKEKGGSVSVLAGVFGARGQGSSSHATSSISRIKFSLPILFPTKDKRPVQKQRPTLSEWSGS
jgi:hypothetical protein